MEQQNLLEQQLRRIITKLFKECLVIVDDLRQDQLAALAEISNQFPPETLQRFNSLDLPRYSRIRKKILSDGNDAIREILALLNLFEISLKNSNNKQKE